MSVSFEFRLHFVDSSVMVIDSQTFQDTIRMAPSGGRENSSDSGSVLLVGMELAGAASVAALAVLLEPAVCFDADFFAALPAVLDFARFGFGAALFTVSSGADESSDSSSGVAAFRFAPRAMINRRARLVVVVELESR